MEHINDRFLINQSNLDFIISNPLRNLCVNGEEFHNIIGKDTGGGYYKNGYETKIITNGKGKEYLQINIISISCGIIDYEMKILIDILKRKVKRCLGFHGVDLMKLALYDIETIEECVNNHLYVFKTGKQPKK